MSKDLNDHNYYVGKTSLTLREAITQIKSKIKNSNEKQKTFHTMKMNGGLDNYNVIELANLDSTSTHPALLNVKFFDAFMDDFYKVIIKINNQEQF
jgi:hypothetical protein